MGRRLPRQYVYEELNVATTFTDLMSNAFVILVFFLLLLLVLNKQNPSETPPIIFIPDDPKHRFDPGSAAINKSFGNYIDNKIVPEIERASQKYNNVDVVEIIGHTDGQPNDGFGSNLDLQLENAARGAFPVAQLKPASNADLGLMRALAIVQRLRNIQRKDKKLVGLSFRAYSAAQLVLPSGEFAEVARQPNRNRRRIEIRFTRLGKAKTVK